MVLIALLYDAYTPSVEAQLTRDLIALRSKYPRHEFAVSAPSAEPNRLLQALGVGIQQVDDAKICLVYKTLEFWPEHPDENTHCVIFRDLYCGEVEPSLSVSPNPPMYVPREQGRIIRDQSPLYRPAPHGKGPIDPMILMMWGPNGGGLTAQVAVNARTRLIASGEDPDGAN